MVDRLTGSRFRTSLIEIISLTSRAFSRMTIVLMKMLLARRHETERPSASSPRFTIRINPLVDSGVPLRRPRAVIVG